MPLSETEGQWAEATADDAPAAASQTLNIVMRSSTLSYIICENQPYILYVTTRGVIMSPASREGHPAATVGTNTVCNLTKHVQPRALSDDHL